MQRPTTTKYTGLYLHVPFCQAKCRYCAFDSIPLYEGSDSTSPETYLEALGQELNFIHQDFSPDTVFMGGGTPTALSVPQIQALCEKVKTLRHDVHPEEWTCETNPGTLTPEKLEILKRAGVNRISLGIQSFNDNILRWLGRIHSAKDARESCQMIREAGNENLNIDLMFGIPGTNDKMIEKDLESIIELQPEHISAYCLSIEPGTLLEKLRHKGERTELQDHEARQQYDRIRHTLRDAGYHHYEISNFARPGRECRHNILYWTGGEYLGFGPSACSHWGGERFENVSGVEAYCQAVLAGQRSRSASERLPPDKKAREILVMWLRMIDGVGRQEFIKATGFDFFALRGPVIERLMEEGWLVINEDRLKLTPEAYFVSNRIFSELV